MVTIGDGGRRTTDDKGWRRRWSMAASGNGQQVVMVGGGGGQRRQVTVANRWRWPASGRRGAMEINRNIHSNVPFPKRQGDPLSKRQFAQPRSPTKPENPTENKAACSCLDNAGGVAEPVAGNVVSEDKSAHRMRITAGLCIFCPHYRINPSKSKDKSDESNRAARQDEPNDTKFNSIQAQMSPNQGPETLLEGSNHNLSYQTVSKYDDSISTVHSSHSENTPDLSLIYEPCHLQKSINRALILLEKGPKQEKRKRRREEEKEETPPRPPPEFRRAAPLTPEFRRAAPLTPEFRRAAP
ncbi:hypothetical protein M5K25_024156 [Dendrobium thyrsiflorum]|uniref:Uncharacterized protein n=1 Tax=Dendrobium thyrsiflorum TaxID=117978 RepID=A0ABD0U1K4_DENTH